LLSKLRIDGTFERGKSEPIWTLYHRLTLAIEGKSAIVALKCSKLLCRRDESDVFAISNEDSGFTGRNKNGAILTIVDVEIGGDIEDEEGAIRTPVNIVLLLLNGIDGLHLELPILFEVSIVVRIVLLFYCLRLENVSRKCRPWLCWFRLS
jgi:hypothetical protein